MWQEVLVNTQSVRKQVTSFLCQQWAFLNWDGRREWVGTGQWADEHSSPLRLDGVIPVNT